jgi:hypothetical protein
MKRLFLFSFLAITCCCLATTTAVLGKVTSYGLFRFTTKPGITDAPELPGGAQGVVASMPVLISATNRVPAKIGVRFGLTFEITNVPVPDGEVELTKSVRHPPITAPDGTTSSHYMTIQKFAVRGGRVIGWTGYGFDVDNELVTGDWNIEMQFGGKTICSQKFTVVKE